MKACAPGKLILSGEHSVVYGAPAIATAVVQQATVSFTPTSQAHVEIISDRLGALSIAVDELTDLQKRADQKFTAFTQGELSIDQVLDHPLQLIAYCLAFAGFDQSGQIEVVSDIPAGAGMGSSAAVIAAVLKMAGIQDSPEQFVQSIRFCERLQHGDGSVIDASTVALGGTIKVEADQVQRIDLELGDGWYIWNSGQPQSSTGETVAWVREHHADSAIWTDFSAVTNALFTAISGQDRSLICSLIMENQRLLTAIGVVPESVSRISDQIAQLGGAAKVCGAGSLVGECGGQVIVYLPSDEIDLISKRLGLNLIPLKQAFTGASRVDD